MVNEFFPTVTGSHVRGEQMTPNLDAYRIQIQYFLYVNGKRDTIVL